MNVSAISKTGFGKKECEDSSLIDNKIINNGGCQYKNVNIKCVCIADGVGGISGGKDASMFVAEKINEHKFDKLSADILKDFFKELNGNLLEFALEKGKKDMATTLTALFFGSPSSYIVHIGNTRLYALRGSYLKQLTTDQTTYQYLIDTGQYDAAENCNKNEIIGCLGGGNIRLSERLTVSEISSDDIPNVMLMTSDGVHEYINIDDMENMIAKGENDMQIVSQMVEYAEKNGSTDDKTAIIIRR